MDETAYRSVRGGLNRLPCVFEKALLLHCATCSLAHRHALAEREILACTDPEAHAGCRGFYFLLREKSSFALKLADPAQAMPHALEMKLQCGGLRGFQESLGGQDPRPEVSGLLQQALERYGDLSELPYSQIIQGVAAWQGRRPTRQP